MAAKKRVVIDRKTGKKRPVNKALSQKMKKVAATRKYPKKGQPLRAAHRKAISIALRKVSKTGITKAGRPRHKPGIKAGSPAAKAARTRMIALNKARKATKAPATAAGSKTKAKTAVKVKAKKVVKPKAKAAVKTKQQAPKPKARKGRATLSLAA